MGQAELRKLLGGGGEHSREGRGGVREEGGTGTRALRTTETCSAALHRNAGGPPGRAPGKQGQAFTAATAVCRGDSAVQGHWLNGRKAAAKALTWEEGVRLDDRHRLLVRRQHPAKGVAHKGHAHAVLLRHVGGQVGGGLVHLQRVGGWAGWGCGVCVGGWMGVGGCVDGWGWVGWVGGWIVWVGC